MEIIYGPHPINETKNYFVMKRAILLIMVMVFSLALNQPSRIIKGIVTTNDSGDPMAGVTVIEKGTTNKTVTDSRGEFELMLKFERATLVFSFVGFEQKEVKLGKEVWIYVKMMEQPLEELIEVEPSVVHRPYC